MRKQTKIVAALSATALLALGASAVTFAAGWDNSTGTWQYLDNNGSAVTDVWRKSGDYWFYLDSDGNMATDKLVEKDSDFYYVNAEGAMVTNQWVALDSDSYDTNSDDGEAEYRWYYFGADGKAYRNKKSSTNVTTSELKTINGKKYAFDADGKMLYGWVNADNAEIQTDDTAWQDAKYYFGGWNDGAATTGWVQLTVDTSAIDNDTDTDTYWFWFDSNGKKKANGKKTINGATYYFDNYGRMVDDWADTSSNNAVSSTTSSSNVAYVNGDGSTRKNQWVWAVPAEDYAQIMAGGDENDNDYTNDEYEWWWTQSNGKMYVDGLKKIKGKYYAFDENGRMLSGVVYYDGDGTFGEGKAHYYQNVSTSDDGWTATSNTKNDSFTDLTGDDFKGLDLDIASNSTKNALYFFGDKVTDGSRKTGYQNVQFDDDTYQMYFGTNGKAVTGYVSKIKKYTVNGVVLKADNDTSNYAAVKYTGKTTVLDMGDDYENPMTYNTDDMADGAHVLVNASGTVQKGVKNLKDNNDVYYFTSSDGTVLYAGTRKLTTSKTSAYDYDSSNKDKTLETITLVNGSKSTTYYYAD